MTVETSTVSQSFAGGQSALTFTFRTLVSNPEYVKVKVVNSTTNTTTILTYTTEYTVSVDADGVGGTVTVSPTFSTANTYVVYRETAKEQESDYEDYNTFPADTLEQDLDRAILISQELAEEATDDSRRIKAWATFNGTSSNPITPAASYGFINAVTKSSTGLYVLNIMPTMSTVNYAVILSGGGTASFGTLVLTPSVTLSTTQISITALNTAGVVIDPAYISVALITN